MSINVWPLDAVSSSPSYSGRVLRQTTGAVWMRPNFGSGRPLGARSGILPRQGTIASIAGTTYTIASHVGVLDVESNAICGPYEYAIDADINGTTTALTSGQYRRDLISITLSDPAEDASSVPGAALTYTVGTPNASNGSALIPSTPALSLALAVVLVPPTGSPSITNTAAITVAAGGIIPNVDGTQIMPAGGSNDEGLFYYYPGNTHAFLYFYDPTGAVSPIVTGGTESYTINSGDVDTTGSIVMDAAISTTPIVTATIKSGSRNHSVEISSVAAGTFSYRVFRTDGTNAASDQSASFMWIAIP